MDSRPGCESPAIGEQLKSAFPSQDPVLIRDFERLDRRIDTRSQCKEPERKIWLLLVDSLDCL